MKLLMENWRRYIKEETAAFHGYKMAPTDMRVAACDEPPDDNQWQTGEKGCPQFSHDRGIDSNHSDVQQAIGFLNNIKPSHLIAYSRGAAVAFAALGKSKTTPSVTFVAPAWNRGWVSDLPPVEQLYNRGVIIHGTADDKVPLAHSAQLSLATGMPLYIFDGMPKKVGHINILKHKNNPKAGRLLTDEEKKALLNKNNLTDEEIRVLLNKDNT